MSPLATSKDGAVKSKEQLGGLYFKHVYYVLMGTTDDESTAEQTPKY